MHKIDSGFFFIMLTNKQRWQS